MEFLVLLGLPLTGAVLLGISVFSATFPERNPWQRPWLQNVFESGTAPTAGGSRSPPARSLRRGGCFMCF